MRYFLCLMLSGCAFNAKVDPSSMWFKAEDTQLQSVASQVSKALSDIDKRLKALEGKK